MENDAKDDVVLVIPSEAEASSTAKNHLKDPSRISGSNIGSESPDVLALKYQPTESNSPRKELLLSGQSSPEIRSRSPSLDRPPKIPTETTPAVRPAITKAKSRFSEPPIPAGLDTIDEKKSALTQDLGCNSPDKASPDNRVSATTPKENKGTSPFTPKTQLPKSSEDEKEYEDQYEKEEVKRSEKPPVLMESNWYKKLKFWVLIEWVGLVCITGTLISSLAIDSYFEHIKFSELSLWKWCVLLLVIVCGRLITELFIEGLFFLTKTNLLLRKEVLYFLLKLKKSVHVCIWLVLVLLAWTVLFHGKITRSDDKNKIFLNYVTRGLVSTLVGAIIWLVKTLLMTILAASFHVNTFLDRIKESLYHQHVLKTLSKPPPGAMEKGKDGKGQQQMMTESVGRIRKLKQDEVSAWTMKYLFNEISTNKLFTISSEWYDEEDGQKNIEITSEWVAKKAADQIFENVVKPRSEYLVQDDLLKFFDEQEADDVFHLFEGAVEAGMIEKSMMRNWVVKVYLERKSLGHSLNDALKAVKQLNKVASVLVLIVIIVVWLVLMELATTQVLIFISSQMFVYGNTAKTVFEGILFSFVTRPFDVGDRCVIDGIQMVVEEMSLLTTVFLRYDNEKIYYPNAVLATKSISNLYRSPNMGDIVEFTVDVSTKMESIGALKERISKYIESKPQHWNRKHSVTVSEIENVDKMKMALRVTHTMNHQNMEEKNNRRSDLVFELKKIFEDIPIRYQLLPQEITFPVLVRVLMSISPGKDLDLIRSEFGEFIKGLVCLPIKLPGTRFYKSLKAKERLLKIVRTIVEEKKMKMDRGDERNSAVTDAADVLLSDSGESNEMQRLSLDFISGNLIDMMIPGDVFQTQHELGL